jgi:hypothetical protein
MATDFREPLKTVEEYRSSLLFTRTSLFAPFARINTVNPGEVDVSKFIKLDVEKDTIRAEVLNPSQTEKAHLKTADKTRTFYPYMKGAKMIKSWRSRGSLEEMSNKVMFEYSKIYDKQTFVGEKGNNGLFSSTDADYVTNSASIIPASSGTGFNRVKALVDLFAVLKAQVGAETASNDLLVYLQGDDLLTLWNGITENNETPVAQIVKQMFNATFVEVPAALAPGIVGNHIVVVSNDVASIDTAGVPDISGVGPNNEDEYDWANYVIGSSQVNAEEHGGIINQPLTFATES